MKSDQQQQKKELPFNGFLNFLSAVPLGIIWISYSMISVSAGCCLFPLIYLFQGMDGLYRFVNEYADFFWYLFPWCLTVWGNGRIKLSGDEIPLRESAIVVSNHRWILDWVSLFGVASRFGQMGCIKFFVKASTKWIPGISWGLQVVGSVFLERDWEKDSAKIAKTFEGLKSRKLPFWLVNFIEGTRYTNSKMKASVNYSEKNNLHRFKNVLYPRTKGLVATINGLRDCCDYLYDFTFVYNNDETVAPSFWQFVSRQGGDINVHMRRFALKDLPTNESELTAWCLKMWEEKDELMETFKKTGSFPNPIKKPFVRLHTELWPVAKHLNKSKSEDKNTKKSTQVQVEEKREKEESLTNGNGDEEKSTKQKKETKKRK